VATITDDAHDEVDNYEPDVISVATAMTKASSDRAVITVIWDQPADHPADPFLSRS
jgi:hypothetical protein